MGSSGGWMLWVLCVCFTSLEIAALRVTMRDSSLEVVRGDFVVLPCSFFTSSPLSRLNVIWTLAPFSSPETPIQVCFPTRLAAALQIGQILQVIVYDHGLVIEDPSLIGRVGFTGMPWSADIVLNDTRVSDAGVYRCMVNNPPETADPGIGELVLSVLAPPSLPECQWDGDAHVGGSVTLACSVAEGVPTPQIRWDKLQPEETALPINMDGTSVSGDLSGSVQIVNVSSRTSGLYRCSAANLLGTEHCYVNLSIYSPPDAPSGILQGVLLTLSMSLVLLALLALLLWLHRTGQGGRQGKEADECYNEIRYTPSLMKRSFV